MKKLTKVERQMSWVKTVLTNVQFGVEKLQKEVSELDLLLKKQKRRKKRS